MLADSHNRKPNAAMTYLVAVRRMPPIGVRGVSGAATTRPGSQRGKEARRQGRTAAIFRAAPAASRTGSTTGAVTSFPKRRSGAGARRRGTRGDVGGRGPVSAASESGAGGGVRGNAATPSAADAVTRATGCDSTLLDGSSEGGKCE